MSIPVNSSWTYAKRLELDMQTLQEVGTEALAQWEASAWEHLRGSLWMINEAVGQALEGLSVVTIGRGQDTAP